MTAFPDIHFDVQNVVVEGDQVAIEWIGTGTHDGELLGVPATGRRSESRGSTWSQVDGDGKIVRERTYFDSMKVLRDIGAIPQEAAASA